MAIRITPLSPTSFDISDYGFSHTRTRRSLHPNTATAADTPPPSSASSVILRPLSRRAMRPQFPPEWRRIRHVTRVKISWQETEPVSIYLSLRISVFSTAVAAPRRRSSGETRCALCRREFAAALVPFGFGQWQTRWDPTRERWGKRASKRVV